MTRATTSRDRSASAFAGSPSSISRAVTNPCRIVKNPSGWFSMVRSTTFWNFGMNSKPMGTTSKVDPIPRSLSTDTSSGAMTSSIASMACSVWRSGMNDANGSHHLSRWYRSKPSLPAPIKSDGEAREELHALYKQAVRRHLISDVPVGLLLSGGNDSGLLLALMNLYGTAWPTYTVGYGS